jgi:dienelactone hydrolase
MIRTLALLLILAPAQDKRKIPPPGIPVPEADRAELEAGLKELARETDPDVRIFHKAVDWALRYDEILNAKEIPTAKALLKDGLARARQLREGKPSWTTATGLVVRAYVSRIDGSVQPYGLVIPPTYRHGTKARLDFWLHGRSETLTELAFVSGRQKSAGDFTPADTIVCHLYGRFCNASKFAGEVDLFEALDHLKKRYSIDEDRISVRGFSMGGASTWHLGAHHAGLWACVAPGAGFAETPVYAGLYKDPVKPTEWEEKLWHWYNATDYAANLWNTSVVAYSGELDKQKAAADTMARAMKDDGLELVHVIGPKVEHKYEPEAKKEVARLVDEKATKGRDADPKKVRFTTWTLQYNQMKWVTVDALEKHWERARVEAEIETGAVKATTQNVAAVSFTHTGRTVLDGQDFSGGGRFHKVNGRWSPGPIDEGIRKRHGLQGPVDDAFMDSFLFVTPSGKSANPKVDAWVAVEEPRAAEFWRRIMRGDARVAKDDAVTDADIASSNLVLWGDPSGNRILARIADRLPIRWDAKEIKVGAKTFPADHHLPVLVYPNPLNPKRYVVLNSGFTWQENAHLSNARHVPILPDWAVLDTDKPNTLHMSERVAAAGFFDEEWKLP